MGRKSREYQKTRSVVGFTGLLMIFALAGRAMPQSGRVGAGFAAGLGLPRIPIARFRSPVSIAGGVFMPVRLHQKLLMQGSGFGLYTFDLGTVDSQSGTLKFNLYGAAVDVGYNIRGAMRNETFIIAGAGLYRLSQQFDDIHDNVSTAGICFGLLNWLHRGRMSMIVDIRWHLLFNPSPNPQLATILLGIKL
jgi:hypothetical protein